MTTCPTCKNSQMQMCPVCGSPLTILDSQNKKLCVDHPLTHVIDNPLKPDQKPLVSAQR